MIRVVSSTTAAMGANDISVILHVEIRSCIDLIKGYRDLQVDARSSLFLLLEHAAEEVTEWRASAVALWFIDALLAASVILPAFICVFKDFISIRHIMEQRFSFVISLVLVGMVFQSQLFVCLFDVRFTSIFLELKNLVHVSFGCNDLVYQHSDHKHHQALK